MRETKDRCKKSSWTRSCLLSGAFIIFCIFGRISSPERIVRADAATLHIHNYVTDDSYDYTGIQVTYTVNGKTLSTDYPGLVLSNGASVGSYKEIFENELGVTSDYKEGKKTFTLFYGTQTIQMTLGNTQAVVNGKVQTMQNAPFLYSFQNSTEKYLYVPTRFVAEAFGLNYVWNSTTSTVSIDRPNVIYDGKEAINYTGISPSFSLNNHVISSGDFPGYIFDGVAFFSAEDYFEATGMASFDYAEGSGLILLKKDDVLVRLVLDSPVAYINDTSCLLDTVPRLIMPQGASEAKVYLPAVFVAQALGYDVSYHDTTGELKITGNVHTSMEEESAKNETVSGEITTDTASYGKVIFSYEAHEQVVSHLAESGIQVPTSVVAYSCLNSDALYFKGISFEDVRITDKEDIIEIVINSCQNPFGQKSFYDTENSYLNYSYLFGTGGSFKMLIFKAKDLQYYAYKAPDGCVIHFTDTLGLYQDYLNFIVATDKAPENMEDTTDIFSSSDLSELLPAAVFSREHFVMRLPDGITKAALADSDDYSNMRFTITLPGNHVAFLTAQDKYNPVSTLKDIRFSYNLTDDTTVITFYTTKIQGYTYTVGDGYLAVRIANPSEIYSKIVVLDAGHGGIDPGTLRGSVYEKTINFNVLNLYAKEYFDASDIKVYYTRTTDTKIALQTRADFAALVEADFFISFHVNANSSSAVNGTSVYYSTSNNAANASGLKSSTLATVVGKHLSNAWNTKNRGILSAKFVVIHNNSVPAILVECGFITNDSDFAKIKDTAYQKKAAKAVFDAVNEIFENYPTGR